MARETEGDARPRDQEHEDRLPCPAQPLVVRDQGAIRGHIPAFNICSAFSNNFLSALSFAARSPNRFTAIPTLASSTPPHGLSQYFQHQAISFPSHIRRQITTPSPY